jgi:hypothetical protein
MKKAKQIGIILMVIGMCIPLFYLAFHALPFPKVGFIVSFQKMEIKPEEISSPDDSIKSRQYFPDKIVIEIKDGKTFEFPPGTTEDIIMMVIQKEIPDRYRKKRKPYIPTMYIVIGGIVLVLAGIACIAFSKKTQTTG